MERDGMKDREEENVWFNEGERAISDKAAEL